MIPEKLNIQIIDRTKIVFFEVRPNIMFSSPYFVTVKILEELFNPCFIT